MSVAVPPAYATEVESQPLLSPPSYESATTRTTTTTTHTTTTSTASPTRYEDKVYVVPRRLPTPGTPTDGAMAYTAASAGAYTSYLLQSNGSVACTSSGGVISSTIPAPEKSKYTAVSAGVAATYLLRQDGTIDRIKSGKVIKRIHAPGTATYTAVSAGSFASYFLRSDGVVDRTVAFGNLQKLSFVPPVGALYIGVSAGTSATYLTRSDGAIDRVYNPGSNAAVQKTLRCADPGDHYIGVSSQIVADGQHTNPSTFYIRASGRLDLTQFNGVVKATLNPPPGTRYIAAAAGITYAYALRSDGVVDRMGCGSWARVSSSMNPPPGTRYTGVTTSLHVSYMLRSDGKVDRTAGSAIVSKTLHCA